VHDLPLCLGYRARRIPFLVVLVVLVVLRSYVSYPWSYPWSYVLLLAALAFAPLALVSFVPAKEFRLSV
jgi:hypothetical protein